MTLWPQSLQNTLAITLINDKKALAALTYRGFWLPGVDFVATLIAIHALLRRVSVVQLFSKERSWAG